MEHLTIETFKTKIFDFEKNKEWSFVGDKPVIIDFYADWCGPCQQLAPVLDEVSADYAGKLEVYKVNTETDPELSAMFGIRGIPAILFVPLKGEPAMASGFMPKESFERAIKDLFGL